MTNIIGSGVSVEGIIPADGMLTFNLASGITTADIGKAVTIDSTGSTQVKLADANSAVFGRLETVEDRVAEGILVGTIATEGGLRLPKKSGSTIAVGDTAMGSSTAGSVDVIAVSTDTDGTGSPTIKLAVHGRPNVVTEVGSDYVVIWLR